MDENHNKKVILNVSCNKITCLDIVKLLYNKNIEATLTPNINIHCSKKNNKKKCWIENGCNIQLYNVKNKQIKSTWNEIQKKFGLYCVHLRIPNKEQDNFSGCIHTFLKNNK